MVFVIVLALVVMLAITLAIRASASAKRRTAALQAFAQENGLDFAGENPTRTIDVHTALFDRGSSRRFRNIMNGKWGGLEVSLFDYQYTINTGESLATITQTVAAFVQNVSLPWFELRPEGFMDRVGEVFVHRDIDFDSNPVFSRRYMLRGKDQDAVRALFVPALLSYMEMLPAGDQLHIEAEGFTLLFYRAQAQVPAENMRSFLEEMSGVAGTFLSSCGKPGSSGQVLENSAH